MLIEDIGGSVILSYDIEDHVIPQVCIHIGSYYYKPLNNRHFGIS